MLSLFFWGFLTIINILNAWNFWFNNNMFLPIPRLALMIIFEALAAASTLNFLLAIYKIFHLTNPIAHLH